MTNISSGNNVVQPVMAAQNVSQTQNVTKQNNKILLVLLADDWLSQRVFLQQLGDTFFIAFLLTSLVINTTIVIVFVRFQKNNAISFFVTE